jgi:hypothetical protein
MQFQKNFLFSFFDDSRIIFYRFGFTWLFVMGLAGCSYLTTPGLQASNLSFGSNVTLIRSIQPEQEAQGATVYVQGKVESQVPLLNQWAYQINDSTGKIWVVTNQPNLQAGQRVVIRGKIRYKSIPLANEEFGEVYLEEE